MTLGFGFAFTLSEICHLWPTAVNAMTIRLSRHENDALFRRAGFTEATVHQARMVRSRDIGAVAARETIGWPNSPLATDFRHPDGKSRILRVVTLDDGETIHNAFFDRNFR